MKYLVNGFVIIASWAAVIFSVWTVAAAGYQVTKLAKEKGYSDEDAREKARAYGEYLGVRITLAICDAMFKYLGSEEQQATLELKEVMEQEKRYWNDFGMKEA